MPRTQLKPAAFIAASIFVAACATSRAARANDEQFDQAVKTIVDELSAPDGPTLGGLRIGSLPAAPDQLRCPTWFQQNGYGRCAAGELSGLDTRTTSGFIESIDFALPRPSTDEVACARHLALVEKLSVTLGKPRSSAAAACTPDADRPDNGPCAEWVRNGVGVAAFLVAPSHGPPIQTVFLFIKPDSKTICSPPRLKTGDGQEITRR